MYWAAFYVQEFGVYSKGRGELRWHFIRGHVIIEMVHEEDGEQDGLEKGTWKKIAQL